MINTFLGLLLLPTLLYSAGDDVLQRYQKASRFYSQNELDQAYLVFNDLEKDIKINDEQYINFLYNYAETLISLEKTYYKASDWEKSIYYGNEALRIIDKGKRKFCSTYNLKGLQIHKDLMLSNLRINQIEVAKKHQNELVKAYKKNQLPSDLIEFALLTF